MRLQSVKIFFKTLLNLIYIAHIIHTYIIHSSLNQNKSFHSSSPQPLMIKHWLDVNSERTIRALIWKHSNC